MPPADWRPERPCPIPGHPQDDGDHGGPRLASRTARLRAWLLHAPAERLPLPAILTAWPACWIAHAARVPGRIPAYGAAGAVALAWLTWQRHQKKSPHPRLAALEAAAIAAAGGGWVTAAVTWGPLGWPYRLLTWIYLTGSAAGYGWLRTHAAVRAARQRRDDAAADLADRRLWHQILPRAGLGGWHVQWRRDTFLGEERLITTSPENASATRIAGSSAAIAERLAHILGLPYGRIDFTTTDYPGELIIGIRAKDPSVNGPVTHPALAPDSPYKEWFPGRATIRRPVPVGVIPETGEPMEITLWDEEGGKAIGVFAMTGGGKTNMLNVIRERVTAMDDAVLIQLNAAGMSDELAWEQLAAATVAGLARDEPETEQKILGTLQGAQSLIGTRTRQAAEHGENVFQPTHDDPAAVVLIDEVDETGNIDGASQVLEFLASKQRKAAVCLILAGQRATAQWTGGSGVRINLSTVVTGLLARESEGRHAVGAENEIPDISEYSRGEAGFFQVWSVRKKKILARGRAFWAGKPREQEEKIIACRDPAARPHLDIPQGTPRRAAQGSSALRDRLARARARNDERASGTVPAAAREAPAPDPAHYPAVPGVPPDAVARLMAMLSDGRVSAAAAGLAIGVSKTVAYEYLSAMRKYGIADLDRRGRGSGWRLTTAAPPDDDEDPAEYVTVHALARAVHDGLIDVDDDTRQVLEQAWALAHSDEQ